jgi:hypothetical protein
VGWSWSMKIEFRHSDVKDKLKNSTFFPPKLFESLNLKVSMNSMLQPLDLVIVLWLAAL